MQTYDLAAGGVDIAPTTDNLSKDVLEKIEKAKKDIIAGDLGSSEESGRVRGEVRRRIRAGLIGR